MQAVEPQLELHLIPYGSGESYVVFEPVAKIFFRANRMTAEALGALTRGESIESTSRRLRVRPDQLASLTEQIRAASRAKAGPEDAPAPSRRICGKLSFHLSNDCNMRCSYCYAVGGNYGLRRDFMSPEQARRILDLFYGRFDEINEILFFGGEPLLNFPAMEAVCDYLETRCREDRSRSMPQLGVVTNLSRIPKGFPELVKRRGIQVTVSLDGPPEIHDANRPFVSGRGTHSTVARNIRVLQQLTGQPSMIEATFTRQHLEAGWTLDRLRNYFLEEFGIRNAEIADVSVPDGHPAQLPPNYVKNLVQEGDVAVEEMLEALTHASAVPTVNSFYCTLSLLLANSRPFEVHCNAGIHQYAVATNGDLYPCHMFVGSEPFRMGNIFDEGVFDGTDFGRVRDTLMEGSKNESGCGGCWARNLCLGCVARCYLETGCANFAKRADCDGIRGSLEKMLVKLAQINESPEKWQSFMDNFAVNATNVMTETPC